MPVVDVHTHFYPPSFVSLLQARSQIPYITNDSDGNPSRLIILPSEEANPSTSRGRPLGPDYYSLESKLHFMKTHSIDISVISLANPWLDWVSTELATETAKEINNDMEKLCATPGSEGKLFAFGTLPLSGTVDAVVAEVHRLTTLPHMRGIVMGTSGFGKGLDDPSLDPVWEAMEKADSTLFLHPHYGLPSEVYGPQSDDYGHVLPLALGFPLETTIAVTRMYLSQVWDKFPKLKVLIAHSGGTLPFLAGRIESCIAHDAHLKKRWTGQQRRDIWDVLKNNVYLDAVIYDEIGLKAAVDASGADRIMFGTDHPFFPPLDKNETQWLSVGLNSEAVKNAYKADDATADAIMGGNAVRALRLTI